MAEGENLGACHAHGAEVRLARPFVGVDKGLHGRTEAGVAGLERKDGGGCGGLHLGLLDYFFRAQAHDERGNFFKPNFHVGVYFS